MTYPPAAKRSTDPRMMKMISVPDHPVIRNMERTGWPDGEEPSWPVCPVCGAETDTFYQNKYRVILGCSECVHTRDAWEYYEED